jgi:hypothetical protein
MMTRKTIGLLTGALVVLAAASILTSRQRYGAAEGGGFEELLGGTVDAGSVQTLRAWVGAIPDSTVELARQGDGWVVTSRWGWKAKKDLVDRLLEDLNGLRGELRSSSADVLADYQIDEQDGMHLVGAGAGGTELFHVVVGKTALRGGSFVRRDGSNDVYLCAASLRSSFGLWGDERKAPDAKRWIELRIVQADRADVDRVVIRDGKTEIVLEKEFPTSLPDTSGTAGPPKPDRSNWTWKPDAAGEFDKTKADGLLGTLCNLYATDVAEPKDAAEYGLADGARSAQLVLSGGETILVRFGSTIEAEKKAYVRVGDDGLPGKIYQSTVDRVFPKRGELKPQAS